MNVQKKFLIAMAIGEGLRDLGPTPSGALYAHVMGRLSLEQYEAALDVLKRYNLITEFYHVLTWVGPAKRAEP